MRYSVAFVFGLILLACLSLSACAGGGGGSGSLPGGRAPQNPTPNPSSKPTPKPSPTPTGRPTRHRIAHIVLMIQENRTFNDLFAGFPGATTTTTGEELVQQGSQFVEQPINLTEVRLASQSNVTHRYAAFLTAYQNGAMDGFNLITSSKNGKPVGDAPYQYVYPSDVKSYWAMAQQWGLANAMFETQGSDSFTAHQDLIRGGTCITAETSCNNPTPGTLSLIDPPTTSAAWGCDSSPGAKTWVINVYGQVTLTGPFPCSNRFPNYGSGAYRTLRDLLDAKGVSWRYYTPVWEPNTTSALWDAFDVVAPVRYGPEWTDGHISSPETNIFSDISNGTLPAMSWVIPTAVNSDHPGYTRRDTGPAWVASVVNAIGHSSYWNSTAVIVVWDDWGGFYDPVAPPLPRDEQGGPGFRVPMILVSPYVKSGSGSQGGYISNTIYQFGSILRFVEETYRLGHLGTTDATSASIDDMMDLKQSPRPFKTIPAEHGRAYFLHQKPSRQPVDDE